MALNDELKKGVEQAVREMDQPPALAAALNAWLNELSQRDLNNQESSRHLQSAQNAVVTAAGDVADED